MGENVRAANGLRRSPFYVLTESDIVSLLEDIKSIKADEGAFMFNYENVKGTGYIESLDKIAVRGNVLPDLESGSKHPRDIMSARAVLAHEYYGHKAFGESEFPRGAWEDEYRASYTAAMNTPNLTAQERRHLVLDAIERKREAGVVIEYDDFIRSVLYGGD